MRYLAIALLIILAPAYSYGVIKANPKAGKSEVPTITSTGREDSLAELRSLHGKRERRLFRLHLWARSLKGDMKHIYDTYGFPSTRYREETMGRVTEKWTYLTQGLEFTFRDGKLIKTRHFIPSSR